MPDFTAPTPEMIVVLPELLLVAAVFLILLVDPFTGRDRTAVVAIALSGLLASGVAAVALSGQEIVSFGGMVALDGYAVFFKVLFAAAGVLTVLMSPKYLEAHGRHIGEYYALLVLAIVGMDLMAAARDLIAFYVALELMAISSYLLAGFFRNHVRSSEAALKYFITGALASALTLYGISLVYGMTGATNYYQVGQGLLGDPSSVVLALATALIVIGMGFKVSVAPFHMWTPDVYQGAPTPIAGFFSVGPKAAGFSAIVMVLMTVLEASQETWSVLLIFLSLLTMATGTLMALVQKNVKRMLAYSSIAHVGYLLAGLAAMGRAGDSEAGQSVLLYLAAYTFMNLGAFGILAYLKSCNAADFDYSLESMAGLGRRSAPAAILMTLFMFSLTGMPGTAGFIGKFYLFTAVVRADLTWLAVIAVLFSAVSAYYYLRIIVYMFFRETDRELSAEGTPVGAMAAALWASAVCVVLIGLFPSAIWDAAVHALTGFAL